jgi:hypothetical protein
MLYIATCIVAMSTVACDTRMLVAPPVVPPPVVGSAVARLMIVQINSCSTPGFTFHYDVLAWDAAKNTIDPGPLAWKSLNPAAVTVDSNGNVKFVAPGHSTIVVTALSGVTDSAPAITSLTPGPLVCP